ncbi:hypothetical protein [Kocuria sp. CH-021]|uniref:hypothetical protein n=1 Tax=Kocuria sp. CH-021 TaxID=3406735 RepID=UPI003C76C898
MTNQNPVAESVRENARRIDGKFGTQPLAEADLELPTDPSVAEVQNLRDELGTRIADAQEARDTQADFRASAAYQRATLKMVGTALREVESEADELYFAPTTEGTWGLVEAMDHEGKTVELGETVPGTDATWEDVGNALMTTRDGFHITDMATATRTPWCYSRTTPPTRR